MCPAGTSRGRASAEVTRLDEAYRDVATRLPSPPGGSLLLQTALTGPLRRALVPLIPLQAGWDCLDLGTGYGPLAFELARAQPVRVVGVDRDPAVLDGARGIAQGLADWLDARSEVGFLGADVEQLPFDDEAFDLVTARLLFQHLGEPGSVVDEMWRVLRPGGFTCVFDVDDGLSATYPPDDGPVRELESAYLTWQQGAGGDRRIGRKLSVMLTRRGFAIEGVAVLPQAQHATSAPGDAGRTVTAARFRAAREGILDAGIFDAEGFDRALAVFESAPTRTSCRIECQVAVVASRPPAT